MAHLWIHSPADGWAVLPLAADRFTLSADAAMPVQSRPADHDSTGGVVLRRTVTGDAGENWLLLAPPREAWINGQELGVGARVLRDKDEIRRQGAAPMYFSTEVLAQVAAFPGFARPAHCPRCRQVIEAGTPAVQCPCPGCRMWHHQSAGCECWTYGLTCAVCDQATALDAGYRWQPEGAP
jgi:hypothetical protein